MLRPHRPRRSRCPRRRPLRNPLSLLRSLDHLNVSSAHAVVGIGLYRVRLHAVRAVLSLEPPPLRPRLAIGVLSYAILSLPVAP